MSFRALGIECCCFPQVLKGLGKTSCVQGQLAQLVMYTRQSRIKRQGREKHFLRSPINRRARGFRLFEKHRSIHDPVARFPRKTLDPGLEAVDRLLRVAGGELGLREPEQTVRAGGIERDRTRIRAGGSGKCRISASIDPWNTNASAESGNTVVAFRASSRAAGTKRSATRILPRS
jgi:hypothetical protein